MHERVFSEGEKLPATKKKIAVKMSGRKNSGDGISSGEIGRGENIMR